MQVEITPIAKIDIADFRACLDRVARERQFLAFLEAPALEHMQEFITQGLHNRVPRVVGRIEGRLIGWCDIQLGWPDTLRHRGILGMGVLPEYRGQGIGRRLLENCLTLARQGGVTRVELEARSDNKHALRLYHGMGFEVECIKQRGIRVDDEYKEITAMALLL